MTLNDLEKIFLEHIT